MTMFARMDVTIKPVITFDVPVSKVILDLRDIGMTGKPDHAVAVGGTPFSGPVTLQGWTVTWEGDSVPAGAYEFALGLTFDDAAKITPT
jgi:hypothetical protein